MSDTPTPPTTSAEHPKASVPHLARLERLERDNARLRRMGAWILVVTAVLLGVAGAIVVVAARRGMPGLVPEVVEAREFVLRDREGHVRGAWGSDDEGAIRLVLQDHRNGTSIRLNLLDDGSTGLTFSDSTGNQRVVLAALPDETSSLVFADRLGLTRSVLSLGPTGAATLVFADKGGITRTGIGVDSRGKAMLTVAGLSDEAGPAPEENMDSAAVTQPPPPAPVRRRP